MSRKGKIIKPVKKVKEHIHSTNYKRKKGLLYFLDKDGDLAEGGMCGIIGRDKNGRPIYQKAKKVVKILSFYTERDMSLFTHLAV